MPHGLRRRVTRQSFRMSASRYAWDEGLGDSHWEALMVGIWSSPQSQAPAAPPAALAASSSAPPAAPSESPLKALLRRAFSDSEAASTRALERIRSLAGAPPLPTALPSHMPPPPLPPPLPPHPPPPPLPPPTDRVTAMVDAEAAAIRARVRSGASGVAVVTAAAAAASARRAAVDRADDEIIEPLRALLRGSPLPVPTQPAPDSNTSASGPFLTAAVAAANISESAVSRENLVDGSIVAGGGGENSGARLLQAPMHSTRESGLSVRERAAQAELLARYADKDVHASSAARSGANSMSSVNSSVTSISEPVRVLPATSLAQVPVSRLGGNAAAPVPATSLIPQPRVPAAVPRRARPAPEAAPLILNVVGKATHTSFDFGDNSGDGDGFLLMPAGATQQRGGRLRSGVRGDGGLAVRGAPLRTPAVQPQPLRASPLTVPDRPPLPLFRRAVQPPAAPTHAASLRTHAPPPPHPVHTRNEAVVNAAAPAARPSAAALAARALSAGRKFKVTVDDNFSDLVAVAKSRRPGFRRARNSTLVPAHPPAVSSPSKGAEKKVVSVTSNSPAANTSAPDSTGLDDEEVALAAKSEFLPIPDEAVNASVAIAPRINPSTSATKESDAAERTAEAAREERISEMLAILRTPSSSPASSPVKGGRIMTTAISPSQSPPALTAAANFTMRGGDMSLTLRGGEMSTTFRVISDQPTYRGPVTSPSFLRVARVLDESAGGASPQALGRELWLSP